MMSSQHRDPAITVRPPAEVTAAGRAALNTAGWELKEFMTAALAAVAADPKAFLAALAAHRPPPAPRGRPKREP